MTRVDPDLDVADVNYTPKNAQDSWVHSLYTPEMFADAPVSLQIVGRRQEDEKVLAALAEIERAMGRTSGYHYVRTNENASPEMFCCSRNCTSDSPEPVWCTNVQKEEYGATLVFLYS